MQIGSVWYDDGYLAQKCFNMQSNLVLALQWGDPR